MRYAVQQMNTREYTTRELAALAVDNGRAVTPRYIAKLCQNGRLPARKVGSGVRAVWLIAENDALRWLKAWLAE